MFNRIVLIAVVLTLGAAPLLSAQMFSAEVVPNPVVEGQPIQVVLGATAQCQTLTGCGYSAFYQGTPNGPLVYQPLICPRILITVGPGQYHTAQWNAQVNNQPIAPGLYYVKIQYRPVNGSTYLDHFVPFRVDPAAGTKDPTLTTMTTATRGQVFGLKLSSPNQPNASYLMAASLTTNTGLPLTVTQHLALDQDFLFFLSLAIPNGPLFNGFLGTLNPFGDTTAGVNIPNVATLQGAQIAVQAAVVDSVGVTLSNPITAIVK